MRTNTRKTRARTYTHEGAPAKNISLDAQLRRSVMSTMLFEDTFYEDGQTIHDRIVDLSSKVKPSTLAAMAIEARSSANLRHVPLVLVNELSKHPVGRIIGDTLRDVIQRADEIPEFMSIYMSGSESRNHPISKQVKRGLGMALEKFDEYQLQKWDRKGTAWRLRDVLFLTHPNPGQRAKLYKRLADESLATAQTWETQMSAAGQEARTAEHKQASKREVFEKQLRAGKLGYMALLRNLRGMLDANVDEDLIRKAIVARKGANRILPFRFIAAARHAPRLEAAIDEALMQNIEEMPSLRGRTAVLIDVSGSMFWGKISAKSELSPADAAAALGAIVNAENLRLFTFSNQLVEVPPRRGMAGVEAILGSQHHGGTDLGGAVDYLNRKVPHDRLIVVSDEQSQSAVPDPVAQLAYMINPSANRNGVGYGKWTHFDGFSESVLRFIHEVENLDTR